MWPFSSRDRRGEPVVGEPVAMVVRWVIDREQVTDAEGNTIALDGTLVVDREVATDSIFWLGDYEDLSGTGFGDETERELWRAVRFRKIPDVKGRKFLKIVDVRRFRGALPSIV